MLRQGKQIDGDLQFERTSPDLKHHHHYHHHHHHHHHHHLKTDTHYSTVQHQFVESTRKFTTEVVAPAKRSNHQQLVHQQLVHQRLVHHNRQVSLERAKQKSQIQFFVIAAFAYILSPVDLIPEVIFGVFGIIDDLFFLFMCMFCVAIVLVYPVFREMRKALLEKLGILGKQRLYNKKS